nr:GLPGLI family protein [uncultured Chryseobacterium sp.]
MKKLTYLVLFLLPFFCYSQTHRFIYSYKFVPDSTKIDSLLYEETRLEVFDNHTEFVSDNGAKRDSAIANAIKNNESPANVKISKGLFINNVFKSEKSIYSIDYIGIQPFKVIQQPLTNWKLTKEKKIIQNYNCQKAEINYGGRTWEAWFTQDIVIHDGPYVFANLPGLIVKINDLQNQHSFLLIANYKVAHAVTNFIYKQYLLPVQINKFEFNKIWNNFKRNPMGATEQFMNINPGLLNGKSFDNNGNEIDFTQKKREEKKYIQTQMLKNNNYIDLQLYKIN